MIVARKILIDWQEMEMVQESKERLRDWIISSFFFQSQNQLTRALKV